MIDPETTLEEIIIRVKSKRDISVWQKNAKIAPLLSFVDKLNSFPKKKINLPSSALRRSVLNEIARQGNQDRASLWKNLGSVFRFGGGLVGTLLILLSLGVGTAVAALESLPGQPMYSLKKVVEEAQYRLAQDETEKATLHIKFTNERVDELEELIAKSKEGKVSEEQVQKIVTQTLAELKTTNDAVAKAQDNDQPKVAILTKLINLHNKTDNLLKSASIESEGEIKIELEKAIEVSKISKEEAIDNMERAGLKVDSSPITIIEEKSNVVTAEGKITSINSTSLSIGTAKFLINAETKLVNATLEDLKVDLEVLVNGEVVEDKTYAKEITLKTIEIKDTIKEPTETQ